MTFTSAIPVPETQIGIAFETERGVPVNPAYWLPVRAPKYKPNLTLLPDETLRGSMVNIYDEVPGLRHDQHGWDAYPYLDTLPVYLKAALGSPDTYTAAPAATELIAEAAAGAVKIKTLAEVAANSWITLGAGAGSIETHLVTAATKVKAGEYELTLAYPTAYAHANKATVTGLSKHQFSLLNNSNSTGNQPPSCTLSDYAGETNWRQLAAAQLDTLTISGAADALPQVTTNWFTNPNVTPGSEPSASFSAAEAAPGWTSVVAIGGTQVGYVVNWEVELKRNVKPIPAITGTQSYYQLFADALEATAKITVLEDPSATWLTAYQNGTSESLDITFFDVQNGWACNLHSSKAKFTTGDLDRSKERVEVPLELQLLPSATDATAGGVSPIIATVANAKASTY